MATCPTTHHSPPTTHHSLSTASQSLLAACIIRFWSCPEGSRDFHGAMGIKFHCPNGHKLNVKAFLAGKKGVCPKCGTRLRIPTASEPGLGGDDEEDSETEKP